MTKNWPKVALMGEHSEYRALLVDVARRLTKGGTKVHWFCSTEEERAYYESRYGDAFASITVANRLYAAASAPVTDQNAVLETARRNEERLGVPINGLAVGDRHLGRGFALGGHRHPRSIMSENTDYSGMLQGFNALIEFWDEQIETHKPDLVVNGGKIAALLCRRHDIPYRKLVEYRYGNYHYWAVDEFYENPEIEERYRELTGGAGDLEIDAPYDTHLQMRSWLTKRLSLWGTVKDIGLTIARQFYWTLRGYEKAKGYFLFETLGFIWRRYWDLLLLRKISRPLSDLEGKKFVYYPLHTEPEAAVQVLSPEYFYQLSSIAAIARDLPAGVMLAVKETFSAAGRRPRDFYWQIAEFKNTVILDTPEYGLEVAAKSDAVATITGSGGFEGAVMGKPVVSFGQHNMYKFLDHVLVVEDERNVAPFLHHVLGAEFDQEKAAEDGKRFLSAVVKASVDLGSFNVRAPDEVTPAVGEAVTDHLVRGMALRSPVTDPLNRKMPSGDKVKGSGDD